MNVHVQVMLKSRVPPVPYMRDFPLESVGPNISRQRTVVRGNVISGGDRLEIKRMPSGRGAMLNPHMIDESQLTPCQGLKATSAYIDTIQQTRKLHRV